MRHKGTVPLETERLILRRFTMDDLEPFYRACLSDYQVWRWTNYPKVECLADMREKTGLFTASWFAAYDRPDRYSWAITLKPGGQAIGRMFGMHPTCLRQVAEFAPQTLSDLNWVVELAYELGQEYWGRGYMTEAVGEVLRFFFEDVGFYRVHCYHASQNPASGRVMVKCGMRYEGTGRMACVCNGGRYDQVNYALLREEYLAGRRLGFTANVSARPGL